MNSRLLHSMLKVVLISAVFFLATPLRAQAVQGPDLTITSFNVTDDTGPAIAWSVTVKNQGNSDVTSDNLVVQCFLHLSGSLGTGASLRKNVRTIGLKSGESYTLDFTSDLTNFWNYGIYNNFELWAIVDPDEVIGESNEHNNIATQRISLVGDPPVVTSLTPANGPTGTKITILGTNFGFDQGNGFVQIGASGAWAHSEVTFWTNTQIEVLARPTTVGVHTVSVTQFGHASGGSFDFRVTSTPPTVTSIDPSSGPYGTIATVHGDNFGPSQGNGYVLIGESWDDWGPSEITSWSNTAITVVVKATGAGMHPVVVSANGLFSNGDIHFEVNNRGPYNGTPAVVPGKIQAENYDLGGNGVAYHDVSDENAGHVYRNDGVDIEACTDNGGGYDVGWSVAGEWLEYTFKSNANVSYTFVARVANVFDTHLGIQIDGGTQITRTVPNTHGYQNWVNIDFGQIAVGAGTHRLRLNLIDDGTNINYVNVLGETYGWGLNVDNTNQLFSLKAVDSLVSWAGGAGGTILRTTDGGINWSSVGGAKVGHNTFYTIEATGPNTAFASTSPRGTTIFKTIDGGSSWNLVYEDTTAGAFIDGIRMFDSRNGMAVGDPVGGKFVILTTTDGGSSWTRKANEPSSNGSEFGYVNSVSATDANHIWLGTNGARVIYSADGGGTWNSAVTPMTDVLAVSFSNASNGICGGSNGIAAITTDGGQTWNATTVSSDGNNIATCVAIGRSGFIGKGSTFYSSNDGGITWHREFEATGDALSQVAISSYGSRIRAWMACQSGAIYASPIVTTAVKDHGANMQFVPTGFTLEQNYPNPFNPGTLISYALPEQSRVHITISNTLGQVVMVLQDGIEPAGLKSVSWKADAGTPSGIYFYRLDATSISDPVKHFIQTRKMLLVK